MTAWQERTIEQRNLLNPAFCAIVVWHLVRGYRTESTTLGVPANGLPVELAFVGASLVLRGQTRDQLPRTIASSLATWVHDNPLERSAVAKGVVVLRDTVREAVLFGALHGMLSLDGRRIDANDAQTKKINAYLQASSDEVKECMRLAVFVGRWLCKAGAPPTVLALLGVQA
ncbi:three component ABC system middle component [Collimonas fungivorans]|uniref:three component ABC system middle component n=1 Tax=Collimonas fungivorans TaxID=158899 RepID=UPI00077880D6|nr:three component ABC system middle component [Collimonas fungivorans]